MGDKELELIEQLRKKGVAVALIDRSCYSGASQFINRELARRDKNKGISGSTGACIITSSSPTYMLGTRPGVVSNPPAPSFFFNFPKVGTPGVFRYSPLNQVPIC